MLSLLFYLVIAPAILAFLLGYSAHGLKKMTASVETEPPAPQKPGSEGVDTDTKAPTEPVSAEAEMATAIAQS